MSNLMRLSVAAGLALAVGWTAMPYDVAAQDKGSVESRQKIMKANSATLKAISAYMKEGKGSPQELEQRVLQIASNANKLTALFPKGTSADDLGTKTTGAKPDIWAKWDDFKKAADNLGTQANKLAGVVKTGDKGAIGKAMGTFGKGACGGCHRNFRQKKT